MLLTAGREARRHLQLLRVRRALYGLHRDYNGSTSLRVPFGAAFQDVAQHLFSELIRRKLVQSSLRSPSQNCAVLPQNFADRGKRPRIIQPCIGRHARFMLGAAMPIETVPSSSCKSLPPTTHRILLNWQPYFSDRASTMTKDSGFKPSSVSLRARARGVVSRLFLGAKKA